MVKKFPDEKQYEKNVEWNTFKFAAVMTIRTCLVTLLKIQVTTVNVLSYIFSILFPQSAFSIALRPCACGLAGVTVDGAILWDGFPFTCWEVDATEIVMNWICRSDSNTLRLAFLVSTNSGARAFVDRTCTLSNMAVFCLRGICGTKDGVDLAVHDIVRIIHTLRNTASIRTCCFAWTALVCAFFWDGCSFALVNVDATYVSWVGCILSGNTSSNTDEEN